MKTNHPARAQLLRLIASLTQEMGGNWTADFNQLDELQDPPAIAVDVRSGDIHFTLVHDNAPESAGLLLIECRFGKVPEGNEKAALAKLLALNYQASPFSATGFAIDETSDEVISTHSCGIDNLTSRSLYASMSGMAELALLWRESFFLDEDSADLTNAQANPPTAKA